MNRMPSRPMYKYSLSYGSRFTSNFITISLLRLGHLFLGRVLRDLSDRPSHTRRKSRVILIRDPPLDQTPQRVPRGPHLFGDHVRRESDRFQGVVRLGFRSRGSRGDQVPHCKLASERGRRTDGHRGVDIVVSLVRPSEGRFRGLGLLRGFGFRLGRAR